MSDSEEVGESGMRVIIDIGNTSVKYALFDGVTLVGDVYRSTHEEVVEGVSALCTERGIEECMIAGVAACEGRVKEELEARGYDVREFGVWCPLPVEIDYATPQTLGVDRIAAVVGAVAKYGKCDMLIIDAGTAVTYDYVSADGHYKGGCISPGLEMRFKALNIFTGKLPKASITDYKHEIGEDTLSAIASGVINGFRYEVKGYIDEFCAKKFKNNKIIVTGGDHKYLVLPMKSANFVAPNLVLEGIAYVAETVFGEKR